MNPLLKTFYCALLFSVTSPIHAHINELITNKVFETLELYPVANPYEEGYLQVSTIHSLYYAQFGNPDGLPVLVLHGGPGAGCSASLTAFFDLSYYRVIMVDQRGAMRSQPFAEMRENNSQSLVEDMELLRKHLAIDKWLLFGGSWGSALAILYGETYPEQILGFVLRGIFLARKKDYEHICCGMRQFFPEIWQSLVQPFSAEEQANLITTLYNKTMDSDPSIHMPVAHLFMHYDTVAGTFKANPDLIAQLDDTKALSIARAFIYYSFNNFFLTDNQLLNNLATISHLPVIIVQGRYDIICPPQTAYDLHTWWNNSQLWFIPEGGHFASDPFIARGLKEALDSMKSIF
jgi:proline iminopeptidase